MSAASFMTRSLWRKAGQIVYDEVERVCNGYLTKSEALLDINSFAIHRVGPSI